mmetsp:Transcript_72010/g.139152  ORF Transcript_72010/g.139152 Transcript_72010/m.139152 type:complete len:441 (-) Transcript_72010:32-1354(-)
MAMKRSACEFCSSSSSSIREHRRMLLSLLLAEVRWQADVRGAPSALAENAILHLQQLGRMASNVHEVRVLVAACNCWGQASGAVSALAIAAVQECSAWSRGKRAAWGPLGTPYLIHALTACLPLCIEDQASLQVADALMEKLVVGAAELHHGQLTDLMELLAMVTRPQDDGASVVSRAPVDQGMRQWHTAKSDEQPPSVKNVMLLRSEFYKRARDLPLVLLPRPLAALAQLLPDQGDFLFVLRRCTSRVELELTAALRQNTSNPELAAECLQLLGGDELGELLHVCAACNYKDGPFLEACRDWVLVPDFDLLGHIRRNVSIVHLLHAFAVLEATNMDLARTLVAAALIRMEDFGFFEILGFLDAASLLQSQADRGGTGFLPAYGVGEQALSRAVARASSLAATSPVVEAQSCAQLLRSMKLPATALAGPVFDRAAEVVVS